MKQIACIHTVASVIDSFTAQLREGIPGDYLIHTMYDDFLATDPARTGTNEVSAVLALSDYNALMALQGREPIALEPGETRVLDTWGEDLATGSLGLTVAVTEDETARQLELRRQVWSANYAGDPEGTEEELLPLLRAMGQEGIVRISSRLMIYQDLMGSKLLALFLGLYLGFTFLLAAAAVLALQQLSQAADNTGRYAMLRRLGAEEKLVARSAAQQVALAFLLPLALALIHTAVGMKAANDLIAVAGRVDSVGSSLITALVLLAVYGGYFLATALACRRMAAGK